MTSRDLAYIALFAAIVAALGIVPPIALPIGVPITAQSMGAMLAGTILGAKRGTLALVLFTVLVLVGLPLLSGGRGGLGVLAGPTAGFFLSWIPVAFLIGYLTERSWRNLNFVNLFLFCALGGVVLCYAIGTPWMAARAGIDLGTAITSMAIFIPGDLLKAAVATIVALSVKKSYPLITAR